MTKATLGQASRRTFLQRASALSALAGTPFATTLASLGALGTLGSLGAQAAPGEDYKALVCVFLFGGNDQSNLIVPATAQDYDNYRIARPLVSVEKNDLLPISPLGYSGTPLGLHPAMGGIQSLFNDKKCAILANVGPLTQPTTKAQWNNAQPTIAVPSQLFSHADQQKVWQTGLPDRASETGWLGRMGDILVPTMQPSSGLSICISTSGDNTIQVGNSVTQYQITPNGAIKIEGLNNLYASNIGSALQDILTQSDGSHLMEDQYAAIVNRSISTESLVSTGLASSATINTVFADDPLSRQLKMVARLIAARTSFGHKRQIFFVGLGGFDFHGDLLRDQAARLKMVNDGLKSFYDASVELNVADQVTAFTASDFGRTLQSNGSGSDHGWGGHHFVVGGAVNGNRIAGTFPTVALGSPEDAGNGNLIPSTSVDQYAADLGRWFGITSANDLRTVMPNYERFSTASLGLFT